VWISVGVGGLFLVEVLVVVGEETIGAAGIVESAIGVAGLFEGMLHKGEDQRLQRGKRTELSKKKKGEWFGLLVIALIPYRKVRI
jgi:hypothetical protein